MAHLQCQDIQIVCSCGSLRCITKLYFCRHCIMLRCGYCVCHEVDTIYCSNCLENLASSEARLKKNRCGTCFSCPCCFHILTTRAHTATSRQLVGQEDDISSSTKAQLKITEGSTTGTSTKNSPKSYYLSCLFCHWSTRDAQIPDQAASTFNNFPQHETKHLARINELVEYYKMLMLREKMEKENRMFFHSTKRGYHHFTEKFGLSTMIARKRAGLPPLSLGRDDSSSAVPQIEPAIASEDVEPLSEDIFTKPVVLTQVTSLAQRFVLPDYQPENISNLFPIHKQLSVKRSQRCKSCLHNIFKPEYGPTSIKFKIHLAAYYYVPEIRMMKKISLKTNEKIEFLMKIINPAQVPTNIQFLQLDDESLIVPTANIIEEFKREEYDSIAEPVSLGSCSSLISTQKKSYPIEKPQSVNLTTTGDIEFTSDVINLPARDDTAEFDDNNDSNTNQDNPDIVVWRKGNKVILKFHVTAHSNLKSGDEVKVGFAMRFSYRDKIISPLEQKESKYVDIDVRHYVNVGFVE